MSINIWYYKKRRRGKKFHTQWRRRKNFFCFLEKVENYNVNCEKWKSSNGACNMNWNFRSLRYESKEFFHELLSMILKVDCEWFKVKLFGVENYFFLAAVFFFMDKSVINRSIFLYENSIFTRMALFFGWKFTESFVKKKNYLTLKNLLGNFKKFSK